MEDNKSLDNEIYQDEISADDIVVTKKKSKNKLIVFFFLFFLVLFLGGFYCLFRFGVIKFNNMQYISGNLFVVHSDTRFGSNVSSFASYNNYDNAFSYTFYVQNDNKDAYSYKVILVDDDYQSNKKNSKISYEILKNSKVLFKGKLDNKSKSILTTQSILPNSVDNYEIKLWSSEESLKLDFKIDVES